MIIISIGNRYRMYHIVEKRERERGGENITSKNNASNRNEG